MISTVRLWNSDNNKTYGCPSMFMDHIKIGAAVLSYFEGNTMKGNNGPYILIEEIYIPQLV